MRLALAIVVSLVSAATSAAQVQSPNDAGGRVSGHVVTGYAELVAGAAVTLTGVSTSGRSERWTTTADANGSFSFTQIPEGRYRLVSSKDGYTNRQPLGAVDELRRDAGAFETGQEVELSPAGQVTDLRLVLHRAAGIAGRVTGPDGSAAPNVQVAVARPTSSVPLPMSV